MNRPRIDVGLPVFNGADGIARTIESVLAQTWADFRLFVSDNASTDGTSAIVRGFAARDERIMSTTHAINIGAYPNYKSLVDRSDAEFFALVAADDWWSPTFLEATVAPLLADPGAVCCVPRTAFYSEAGERRFVTPSTYSLTDARPTDRVVRFLVHPSDCSRFYGLHRRATFAATFDRDLSFHAADWYLVLLEILAGTHLEVPLVLLHRTAPPPDRYVRHWRALNTGRLIARSPLRELRRQLERRLPVAEFREIRQTLARLDRRLAREHRSILKTYVAGVNG